jgi:hypothetical protein
MKKFSASILSLVTLLIVVLSACSSDDTITGEPQPINSDAAKSYTLTISANKGDSNSKSRMTRALELSSDGMEISATWNEGDEVTVYNVTRNADLEGSLVAHGDGASTVLTGTLSGEIAEGDVLTLKFLNPDYSMQEGSLEYIAANCDYAEATVTVASVANGKITTTGDAVFENQQAIVKFTFKNSDGTETLSASQLVVAVGNNSYTVTTTSATGELYVAIPGFSGQDITLTSTDGTSNYFYTKSNVSFAAGEYYPIEVRPKLVSVIWTNIDDYENGGISISGASYGASYYDGSINMSIRRGSGLTFTSNVGFISRVEIICDNIDFTAPSGWSWDSDDHKLIWTATPSASVRLYTGAASAIYDITSIEFTMDN